MTAYSTLISYFNKNMSSQYQLQFLHNHSLLGLGNLSTGGVVEAVPYGGQLGQLNLQETQLDANAVGYGFLVLALDPLAKLADHNRTDNIFIQLVNVVNNASLIGGHERTRATCSAAPIHSGKLGRRTIHYFVSIKTKEVVTNYFIFQVKMPLFSILQLKSLLKVCFTVPKPRV
jgi:hypothetical protein